MPYFRALLIILDYLDLTLKYADIKIENPVFSACTFLYYTCTIFEMIRS